MGRGSLPSYLQILSPVHAALDGPNPKYKSTFLCSPSPHSPYKCTFLEVCSLRQPSCTRLQVKREGCLEVERGSESGRESVVGGGVRVGGGVTTVHCSVDDHQV